MQEFDERDVISFLHLKADPCEVIMMSSAVPRILRQTERMMISRLPPELRTVLQVIRELMGSGLFSCQSERWRGQNRQRRQSRRIAR
jgi:hypothetical protein